MITSTTNEFEGILRNKDWMELVKIKQQKNKVVVGLWKTSHHYEVISDHKWKRLNSWEKRRNAKLHFKRKWRIVCTSRREKKRCLNFSNKFWMNLKNELNHEEPPWRTPVTKGWWDKIEGWNNKMSIAMIYMEVPTKWPRKLNSGKEKMKTLELEFIHQEQTPKEGINQLEEIRIRFIVCLSFIK